MTEQLFSGAILAADAVVVIVALAWLLPAYRRDRHGEIRFFRQLILFTALFCVLMLAVSSDGFDNSLLQRHASWAADTGVWATGLAVVAGVFRCWHKPLPAPSPPMALLHG